MATVSNQNDAAPPGATSAAYTAAQVSQNYQVRLEVRGDEQLMSGSDAKIFPIIAYLPERYNMDFSSSWSSPFAKSDISSVVGKTYGARAGAIAEGALNVAGISTRLKSQSVQVWDSTSPMTFNVQMVFNAVRNSRQDVRDKHKALLKLCAPGEMLGVLTQPGPTIAGQTAGAAGNLIGLSDTSRKITLYIGNYLRLENVIVTGVSSDISTLCDVEGIPINMTINISVQSFFGCFTTKDIDDMFTTN